jgi:hypothetical protein|tara:strand:- start:106 stop:312 length:207 start_codon:yes stop_codon:yes gene_type:complete
MTTQYSSHDYRKNTDEAMVVDEHNTIIRPANDLKVQFKDKHGKAHEVEVSRLIQVFNNNVWNHKRSVK